MDQLAEVLIVARAVRIMPQRLDELFRIPMSNSVDWGKLLWVDVDDGGVRCCQLVEAGVGSCINLLCNCQRISSSFCEADDLLKPSGSGCFQMESAAVFFNLAVDDWVDRKFVAA